MGNSSASFFLQQSASVNAVKLNGASPAGKLNKGFPLFQALLSETLANQPSKEKGFISLKTIPKTLEDLQKETQGKIQIAILPKGSVKFDKNGNILVNQQVLEAMKKGSFEATSLQKNSNSLSGENENAVISLEKSGDMKEFLQTIQSLTNQQSALSETGNVVFIFPQTPINNSSNNSDSLQTSANRISLAANKETTGSGANSQDEEISQVLQTLGDKHDVESAVKALHTIAKSTKSPNIADALKEYKSIQAKINTSSTNAAASQEDPKSTEPEENPMPAANGSETLLAAGAVMPGRMILEPLGENKSVRQPAIKKDNKASLQENTQEDVPSADTNDQKFAKTDIKEQKPRVQPASIKPGLPEGFEGLPPEIQAILQQAILAYSKENPAEDANPEILAKETVKQAGASSENNSSKGIGSVVQEPALARPEALHPGILNLQNVAEESVDTETIRAEGIASATAKPIFIETESAKSEKQESKQIQPAAVKPIFIEMESAKSEKQEPKQIQPAAVKPIFIEIESSESGNQESKELKSTVLGSNTKASRIRESITEQNTGKPELNPESITEQIIRKPKTKIENPAELQPLFTAVKKLQENGKMDELLTSISENSSLQNTDALKELLATVTSKTGESLVQEKETGAVDKDNAIDKDSAKKIVTLPVTKPEMNSMPVAPAPVMGFVLMQTQETGENENTDEPKSTPKKQDGFPEFAAMKNPVSFGEKKQITIEKVSISTGNSEQTQTQAQILEEFSKAVKSTKIDNANNPTAQRESKESRIDAVQLGREKIRSTEKRIVQETNSVPNQKPAKEFINLAKPGQQEKNPFDITSSKRTEENQNKTAVSSGNAQDVFKQFISLGENADSENTTAEKDQNDAAPKIPVTGSNTTTSPQRTTAKSKDPFQIFLEQTATEKEIQKELAGNQEPIATTKPPLEILDLENKRLTLPSLTPDALVTPQGRGTIGQVETVKQQAADKKKDINSKEERLTLPKDKRYMLYQVHDEDLPRTMADKKEKVVMVSEVNDLLRASKPFENLNSMQQARNLAGGLEVVAPPKVTGKTDASKDHPAVVAEKTPVNKPEPKVPTPAVSQSNSSVLKESTPKPADFETSLKSLNPEPPQQPVQQVVQNENQAERPVVDYTQNPDAKTAENSNQGNTAAAVTPEQQTAPSSSAQEYTDKIGKMQDSMSRQIIHNVQGSMGSERSFIAIRLEPESLGTLAVHLKMESGKLTANFMAEKESTRALIEKSLGNLKQSFEDSGLKVDRLTVSRESSEIKQPDNSKSDSQSSRFGRSKEEPASQFSREFNQRRRQNAQMKEWKERLTAEDYFA